MDKYCITGCAVVYDDEMNILLKRDPRRGWELPGGHLENLEAISTCTIREVKEETGIDIELLKFCGISQDVKNNVCHTFWIAKTIGGKLTPCTESLEVGYYQISEAFNMIHRQDFKDELANCLDEMSHPFFILVE